MALILDIYARVSRLGNDRQRSTGGQVEDCEARIEERGAQVGEVHIDSGRSAWNPHQNDIAPRGAAIECRIDVENPGRDFAPTPGVLEEFVPSGGPFVRVGTHGFPGYRIPAFYDSLLAKLVVWAPVREQALDRMDRALAEFRVRGPGVHTTNSFLREVTRNPLFRAGDHSTSVVRQLLEDRKSESDISTVGNIPGAA